MEHQDWKEIIFRNKNNISKNKNYIYKEKKENESEKLKTYTHHIVNQIIKGRCAKNMSQKELANKTNLSVNMISRIETPNKEAINHKHLQLIRKVLNIKINIHE